MSALINNFWDKILKQSRGFLWSYKNQTSIPEMQHPSSHHHLLLHVLHEDGPKHLHERVLRSHHLHGLGPRPGPGLGPVVGVGQGQGGEEEAREQNPHLSEFGESGWQSKNVTVFYMHAGE